MIHGGQRYAIGNFFNKHINSIKQMPQRWEESFNGKTSPNLQGVNIHSHSQYIWTDGTLSSTVKSSIASLLLNSRVKRVPRRNYPAAIAENPLFKGLVFELKEPVVDIKSLTSVLIKGNEGSITLVDNLYSERTKEGGYSRFTIQIGEHLAHIGASNYVHVGGSGNEIPLTEIMSGTESFQRRPLRQLLVKPVAYSFYGHCMGGGKDNRPRVTITSHPLHDNSYVWYLGGKIASDTLLMSENEAISHAVKEMQVLFPHIPWKNLSWGCFSIDRSEPKSPRGRLPDGPQLLQFTNCIIAWPTKLTFIPQLADSIMNKLPKKIDTDKVIVQDTSFFVMPEIGNYPWESIQWKTL